MLQAMPDDPVKFMLQPFGANGSHLAVTHIGNKQECQDMLKLAAEKALKPWVQLYDMKDCGKVCPKLTC